MICFEDLTIYENISIILIERVSDYENVKAYTHGEESIVVTSGALFCFGGVIVMICHFLTSYNLPVVIIGVESVCLLFFRGIYFFLLGSGDIPIGGLLDFALIEIPTFIYIGIFLEIIFPCYRFFFKREMSKNLLLTLIFVSLLLN